MAEQAVLEKVPMDYNKFFETQTAINNAVLARFNEKPVEAKVDGKPVVATLEDPGRKGLGGFMDFEVWGVPLGQIVVAGSISVLATELVDGFLVAKVGATPAELQTNALMRGGIKLVAAGVAAKWGGRIFGSTGAKAMALLIGFDGLRDIIPLDTWIKTNIADRITGAIPTGGLAQGKPVPQNYSRPTQLSALEI